jgi:hypothetical protein
LCEITSTPITSPYFKGVIIGLVGLQETTNALITLEKVGAEDWSCLSHISIESSSSQAITINWSDLASAVKLNKLAEEKDNSNTTNLINLSDPIVNIVIGKEKAGLSSTKKKNHHSKYKKKKKNSSMVTLLSTPVDESSLFNEFLLDIEKKRLSL